MECLAILFRLGKRTGLASILACLFAGIWMTPAAAGEPVTLYLQWYHQFQFAGYYAALEKGYYRELGLDVSIVEGGPGVQTFKKVVSAPGRYGTAHGAGLLLNRAKGEPLVALAVIFQHSPNVIIARSDRGITTPHHLVGTRTVIWPGGHVELSAMLLNEGIDPAPFRHKARGNNVSDLIAGRVDAIDGYITNEVFTVRSAGTKINIIRPSNYGVDFYGDTLISSEREVRDHPKRADAFRKASLLGWKYALAHPNEIIALIATKYSARKSRGHLLYEAKETKKLILPDLVKIGHMNPGRWKKMAATLVAVGMIKPKAVLGTYLYDPARQKQERLRRNQNYSIWGVAGTVIFLAIFLGWGWAWSLRRSVRTATASLNNSLAEKEVLLKEIHHRVKNNLQVISSMLSLQAGTETDNRSVKALKESQRRIKVMARIHENLHRSNDLTSINARDYLDTIIEDTKATYGNGAQRITYRLDADDIFIDVDHAIACGQILSELLSNSAKHAFPNGRSGKIDVTLRREDGGLVEFIVADDGKGIPEGVELEHTETLGMRLVYALAKQMGGTVNVDRSDGTRVEITFSENPS